LQYAKPDDETNDSYSSVVKMNTNARNEDKKL
jgi:hypothetical protein